MSKDLSDEEVRTTLRFTNPFHYFRRFGDSEAINIVFSALSHPEYFTGGYTSFKDHLYVERPPQCRKFNNFGHVERACIEGFVCVICGEGHSPYDCKAEYLRCSNCGPKHASTSMNCLTYKLEKAIYRQKKETKIDYPTARKVAWSDLTGNS